MKRIAILGFAVASVSMAFLSCQSPQNGAIQGAVRPSSAGARIMITKGAATVASISPDAQTGRFSVNVAPGSYKVAVTSSSSPFPVSFPEVVVEPGKTAALGTIEIAQARGTASITGRIRSGGSAARVSLLEDGRERASSPTDGSGNYELKEIPSGRYMLQVQASDYAPDERTVSLGEGQRTSVNIRMLYRTALDGVDWARGSMRVRGVGSPPSQQENPTVRREMAKRAALSDAERNALRVMEMIETGPGEKLTAFLGQRSYTRTIEGYLKGYRVIAERALDGGRIEVEIELPLTGPGGLTSLLPAE